MDCGKPYRRLHWPGFILTLLIVALSACGGDPSTEVGREDPAIASLTAERTSDGLPAAVSVRWIVENAAGLPCLLEVTRPGGDKEVVGGLDCAGGQHQADILDPGTFQATLVVLDVDASTSLAEQSVSVQVSGPAIASLTAELVSDGLPAAVSVRWIVENAAGLPCLLEVTRPGGDKEVVGGLDCAGGQHQADVLDPGTFQATLVVLDVDALTSLAEQSVSAQVSGPEITSLTAEPASGTVPMTVAIEWTVEDASAFPCLLEITRPSGESELIGGIVCARGQQEVSLVEPGTLQATLVVLDVDAASSLAEQSVSATALADAAEAQELASDWILVETDTNPYDLSVEADLFTENASYAGSFKECMVTEQSISYWHVVKTQVADLANVLFTYTFDAPPATVEAGETITLTHSLEVAGEVKVGGGNTPSGRAGYNSEFISPRTLSVSSAGLNDRRYPTTDSDVIQFQFPTDGNWFGIEARVLDTQNPDIACDIAWWYERYEETQD